MTATLAEFEQVIYADFEFVAKPGERPDVVCLAWREEPSGQTYRLWRDQLGDVAALPHRRRVCCSSASSATPNCTAISH